MAAVELKRCSLCAEVKAFADFNRDPNPRSGTGRQSRCRKCQVATSKQYWSERREQKREHDRTYRKRYPEKQRAQYAAKKAKRPAHYRALAKERQRRYRERNPGVGLKGNAERLRRFRLRHPEREVATRAAREAKHIAPAWGDKERIRVVYRKAREYGFEVDHVVPLKHPRVCGLHVWANLQLLDRNLNRAKKNVAWPDMPEG